MKMFSRLSSPIGVISVCLVLLAAGVLGTPAPSSAQMAIGVSVTIAPPPLPVYVQPVCPGPGYIWSPGYWAWDPDFGYYWVPGTWVLAPFIGALWTPGYWGWSNGFYVWNAGYWGPVVGFYGGINYGFGYTGYGYGGGYWRGRNFYYNRTVNNVNITNVRNVYRRQVIVRNVSRVSFNGGRGGIAARPTATQLRAAHQRRFGPVQAQTRQAAIARATPRLRANVNHGRPPIAATQRPGVFRGKAVVPARRAGGPFRAAPGRRQFAPKGRQQYSPRGRQQYSPGGRQQFAPKGRQQYSPRGRQQYSPGGRQQFAPRGRQQFAPRGRQQYTPRGPVRQAPSGQRGRSAPRRQQQGGPGGAGRDGGGGGRDGFNGPR